MPLTSSKLPVALKRFAWICRHAELFVAKGSLVTLPPPTLMSWLLHTKCKSEQISGKGCQHKLCNFFLWRQIENPQEYEQQTGSRRKSSEFDWRSTGGIHARVSGGLGDRMGVRSEKDEPSGVFSVSPASPLSTDR